jgi:hypothetical protein
MSPRGQDLFFDVRFDGKSLKTVSAQKLPLLPRADPNVLSRNIDGQLVEIVVLKAFLSTLNLCSFVDSLDQVAKNFA